MTNTEKIMKIVSLAMEINGECYEIGEKPCVFVRVYPHVNEIDIDIYRRGYTDGAVSKMNFIAYYGGSLCGLVRDGDIRKTITLDTMLAKLQELADEINPPEPRPDIVEV